MGEEKKDCGEAAGENGGGSEDGRNTLEDLIEGRPHLVKLLDQFAVTEKQPGDWLFQEGEKALRCCYVVIGKVEIIVAGETVATAGATELVGVEALLLREERPTHTTAARVVEPTSLVWLDEDTLVSIMGHGTLKGFLRLQARIVEQTKTAMQKHQLGEDKQGRTVEALRRALRETQEDLVAKERLSNFPPRPNAAPPPLPRKPEAPPPYPDLREKLRLARETNQALAKLMGKRDEEFGTFLAELRQILAQNPKLAENKALGAFLKKMEQAVIRRANTLVNV